MKSKFPLLIILMITLISANIELDIYAPALPKMLSFFATDNNHLQWTFSLNFLAIAIGSLCYGPLSDHFGRKKIIMIGLFIFVLGSLGCVFANSLPMLFFWRFIQGLGSAAPGVIGFAAMAEIEEGKKAAQIISITNSIITGSMAGAPIIGNYLTLYFSWRANFIFIFMLALFSLIGMQLIFKETKQNNLAKELNLKQMIINYAVLCKDLKFMILGTIPCLMYSCLILYIANMSVLFVDYLGISQQAIGYYQATIMLTFLIFSFFAAFLLVKFTLSQAQKIGLLVSFISSVLLFIISLILPASPNMISIVMMLFAAGSAIALGPFISQALNVYPELRGTSSALLGAIRLALSSVVIVIGGHLFNGTLMPLAAIILALTIVSIALYRYNH